MRKIIRYCRSCNGEYIGHKSRSYCSPECRRAAPRSAWNKGKTYENAKKRTGFAVICVVCSKEFRVTPCRVSKYCSQACYFQIHKAPPAETRNCAYCKQPFTVPKRVKKIVCDASCAGKLLWVTKRDILVKKLQAAATMTPKRTAQLNAARKQRVFGPETKEKIRIARLKQHFPTRMTRIEQKLHDAFLQHHLEFIMHKSMFGRWQPDFVFETSQLIVQADGDYWHSLPQAIINDANFNASATKHGWQVLRFKETDIHNNLESCIQQVLNIVK